MKKRIRYILVLMIICILGINLFQGYWLFNSYNLAYDQFNRSINGALSAALERKTDRDVRTFLQLHPSFGVDDTPNITPIRRTRKLSRDYAGYFRKNKVIEKDTFTGPNFAFGGEPDRLENYDSSDQDGRLSWLRVSRILMREALYKQPFAIPSLDSFYQDELAQREIKAAYVLDSQQIEHSAFRDEEFRKNFFRREHLQTRWMRIDPVRNIYLQASFQTPYGYLFGKMLWLLIGSFALLILTTWCFIYMLRTILKQKKLSDIKNDFINNMTHELKTPIATVNAAIEALQHFQALDDKSKTRSYLDISRKELQRLSDLVEKVLHVSIEENEDMALQKEKVNVEGLIDHIVERQQLKAGEKAVFHYHHTLNNPYITVDKLHFTNALNNLIDNALKYSYDNVNITIQCQKQDHQFILSVQDDGIGIAKPYQEHVFEKFFRVPTGDIHKVKGFGLGLSYVKKVVERHGGEIQLSSDAGKGSLFTIRMPEAVA